MDLPDNPVKLKSLRDNAAAYAKEITWSKTGNKYMALAGTLQQQKAALVHLVLFDEPFGLSVAEAMCCGTPVIAFNRGAMPELIVGGKTGFLADDITAAAAAVDAIPAINRNTCRH